MTTTRSEESVALVRQLFTWFNDRDIASFKSALAPDVEARPSIDGAPVLRGADAVADWWISVTGLDDAVEVRPLEYDSQGDCVVVRGYLRHRNGRTLSESEVYWLYEVRDGLIVRMESYPTRRAALNAL